MTKKQKKNLTAKTTSRTKAALELVKECIITAIGAMLFLFIFGLGVLQTSCRYNPPKPAEIKQHPIIYRLIGYRVK